MRTLRYLPLVACAGLDGFVLFVPYLLLVAGVAVAVARLRPRPQAVSVAG